MLYLSFKTMVDEGRFEAFSDRGRRRIFKHAYITTLRYWHAKILPRHFKEGNIALYPNSFTPKKKGGVPLVDTGEFSKRIMAEHEIQATYKGAKSRYLFGRPTNLQTSALSDFNKEYRKPVRAMESKTRNHIFSKMKGTHLTFEQVREGLIAQRFKRTTYNAKMKIKMERGINVFSANDREEMRAHMHRFIVLNMNLLGKANFKSGGFKKVNLKRLIY